MNTTNKIIIGSIIAVTALAGAVAFSPSKDELPAGAAVPQVSVFISKSAHSVEFASSDKNIPLEKRNIIVTFEDGTVDDTFNFDQLPDLFRESGGIFPPNLLHLVILVHQKEEALHNF